MLELPRRKTEVVRTIMNGTIQVRMRPLSTDLYGVLNGTLEKTATHDGKESWRWQFERVADRVFAESVTGIHGAAGGQPVLVDGQPFDPANPEHRARIYPEDISNCVWALFKEARGEDGEVDLGKSTPPPASESREETPSTD